MKDTGFARFVIFVNGSVPLVLLLHDAYYHRLGANPSEFAIRTTGTLALLFLIISLAVTPLRKLLGQPWMVKFRRMLGLFGFFYAALHLLIYTLLDRSASLRAVIEDVGKRPFITVGMASFVLLVPLAVTSTQKMIKRLGGKRWNRLHRLVYIAAAGGALHYYMLVKADTREPLLFAAALAALLLYRIANKYLPAYTERKPVRPQPRRVQGA
ncbi:MAG TPA: protein-methionine-sulfoxide reductase heme-binding subunit MsrQ [Blastocatellia bacterium]|nr:protein-methionine-sulfoxide reductase heme-binding subunit MsrQ [Blastocatellia bacterium]